MTPLPFFSLQITAAGPVLIAYVGVSHARSAAIRAAGQQVPQAQQISALVDTGASGTCIEPSVLRALGVSPTGMVPINTPSTGNTPHTAYQYDVSILVPGASNAHPPLIVENLPVIEAQLIHAQGFHALIGRDVLSQCLLNYDGQAGFFTLAY